MLIGVVLSTVFNCVKHDNHSITRAQNRLYLDSLYSFSLKLENSIGDIHDHHGIKIDSKGSRFLFVDRLKSQVIVTDSLGNLEATIGQSGRGPSEFLSIDGINFVNDTLIFVLDDDLKKVSFFNLMGEVSKSFSLENDDYYFTSPDYIVKKSIIYTGILESNYLPYSRTNDFKKMSESKILVVLDTDWATIKMVGSYDLLTANQPDYINAQVLGTNYGGNRVFINQVNSPIIQYYNVDDNKFGVFSSQIPVNFKLEKKFMSAMQSRMKIKEMSIGRTYTERLVPLNNHLFKSIDKLTEEWNITLDHLTKINSLVVYDYDGNILAEKVLEGKRLFGGHGDKLYFLTNNNPDNFTIEVATYRLERK